ncbi:MAG: inorganic pyrophosphatase [Alphaproteobacteria bacterium]|nr:inorganic pyrophosphatase [Alphaproteobacteria bacterium]
MKLEKIAVGQNVPSDINVIIEISMGGHPIKHEMDKESGALFVDRITTASMRLPANYGFIPHTLSGDGDPIDVLVVCPYPLEPLSVIRCRPIGFMMTEDEKGTDEKLIAVPHEKIFPHYANIKSYKDLPEQMIAEIQHYYEHYKDLEKGKWVKISGWKDAAEAQTAILESVERYNSEKAAA